MIAVLALHLVLPAALITGWILAARADAHILTRSSLYASIAVLCALGLIVGGASLAANLADRPDPAVTDSTPTWLLTGNSLFGLLTAIVLWIAARGSPRLVETGPGD